MATIRRKENIIYLKMLFSANKWCKINNFKRKLNDIKFKILISFGNFATPKHHFVNK